MRDAESHAHLHQSKSYWKYGIRTGADMNDSCFFFRISVTLASKFLELADWRCHDAVFADEATLVSPIRQPSCLSWHQLRQDCFIQPLAQVMHLG